MPLKQYLSRYFGSRTSEIDNVRPYVRWYTQLQDVQFC